MTYTSEVALRQDWFLHRDVEAALEGTAEASALWMLAATCCMLASVDCNVRSVIIIHKISGGCKHQENFVLWQVPGTRFEQLVILFNSDGCDSAEPTNAMCTTATRSLVCAALY